MRALLLTAGLLFLGLCLVRPGAQGMHARIIRSISSALGRPVEASWVSLRFLPRPGFELKQFVVRDDANFSAEPVLQAPEVAAVLRVGPLLRGRFEIARLSLTEPSLNLARSREGYWNIAGLLQKTGQSAPGSSNRFASFPYIEASAARVNFKVGQEKKPFALVNADLALWQESDSSWGLRLKAEPVRADFNLTDTGTVEVEGSWHAAANLRQVPLKFEVAWLNAQLGQGTKLLLGNDKGWRGELKINAELSGTPESLSIQTQASVEDFRRYDIATGSSLRLGVKCAGQYSVSTRAFSNVSCRTPVGDDGKVALNGSFSVVDHTYDLTLSAQSVPLQALANLATRAKKGMPQDLTAAGNLEADVTFSRSNRGEVEWAGGGQVINVQLASKSTQGQLYLDAIPFTVISVAAPLKKRVSDRSPAATPHVEVGPVNLELAKVGLTSVKGALDRDGYSFQVQGQTDVPHLLRAARTAGMYAPSINADGPADMDLNVAGKWAGFAAPLVTGKVQLHAVHAQVRGLKKPLELAFATLELDPEEARATNVSAQFGGSQWRGSVTLPRHCEGGKICPVGFDLHADELRSAILWRAFDWPGDKPWYKSLYPQTSTSSFLTTLKAEGKISSKKMTFGNLTATRVSGRLRIDGQQVSLSHVSGEVLGGRNSGEWTADFSSRPPVYTAAGTLDHILLAELALAMNDDWVQGTLAGTYRVKASGWKKEDLIKSAMGDAQWEAQRGMLPHLILSEDEPLRFEKFSGRLVLRGGGFELVESKLQSDDGIYQVSGTASMGRELNLKLIRDGAHGFSVTGPLNDPHVAAAKLPETQAALKP
jgi:uncharacterized protein involved in outer membrane biogenesis